MERLPDIALPSTQGGQVNLSHFPGRTVIFCYPYTGRPGTPDPPNWDNIPGAHGSTPQALGYAEHYEAFKAADMEVFGLNLQDTDWQKEFAERARLPFALLSDHEAAFSRAMKLETFQTGGAHFLNRTTLVVETGIIVLRRLKIVAPELDADETLLAISETPRS